MAEVLSNLGRLYQDTRRYAEAQSCFQEVLTILEKIKTASPAFLAKALNNQGALYAVMGKPKEAEPYLKLALASEQDAQAGDHPAMAGILSNYAAVLRQMKRKGEAKEMENRAKAILARSQPAYRLRYTVNLRQLQAESARP